LLARRHFAQYPDAFGLQVLEIRPLHDRRMQFSCFVA
jgi:hypothetical protein